MEYKYTLEWHCRCAMASYMFENVTYCNENSLYTRSTNDQLMTKIVQSSAVIISNMYTRQIPVFAEADYQNLHHIQLPQHLIFVYLIIMSQRMLYFYKVI